MSSLNQIKIQAAPPVHEAQHPVSDSGGKLLPSGTYKNNNGSVQTDIGSASSKQPTVEQQAPVLKQFANEKSGTSQQIAATDSRAAKEQEGIYNAVAKLNDYVQSVQRDLHFSVDEKTGIAVVKVINRQSEELIRQIPGQLALDLARKLNEQEPLHLFSARV